MPDAPKSPVTEPAPTSTPAPPSAPVQPEIKMWLGGSLTITATNRQAILTALDTIYAASQPMYLLEVQPDGELLTALNDPMIDMLKATNIDSTVPRYFASDWVPERNLSSDRLQSDEFQFSGTVKPFKGEPIQLTETHKKIADKLWIVTVG